MRKPPATAGARIANARVGGETSNGPAERGKSRPTIQASRGPGKRKARPEIKASLGPGKRKAQPEIRASRGPGNRRSEPQIKASLGPGKRKSAPQIKASLGPGKRKSAPRIKASLGPGKRKPPAPRNRSAATEKLSSRDRVDETRMQSLRALGTDIERGQHVLANHSRPSGARGARRQAQAQHSHGTGFYGGVAAAGVAARAVAEVARPAAAAARPVLRVVSGGLDRLPTDTISKTAARGRILIVIVGLLAAGLIYINVGKLEAGDGYGRYAARSLELHRENTILRAGVAQLGSSERIAALAKKHGMVMPQPEQFNYVRSRTGDPLKAVKTYTAPRGAPAQTLAAVPGAATGEPGAQTPSPPTPGAVATPTTPAPGTGTAPPAGNVPPAGSQSPATTPQNPAPAGPPAATGGSGPAGAAGGG